MTQNKQINKKDNDGNKLRKKLRRHTQKKQEIKKTHIEIFFLTV
jgi:hypothetical protein